MPLSFLPTNQQMCPSFLFLCELLVLNQTLPKVSCHNVKGPFCERDKDLTSFLGCLPLYFNNSKLSFSRLKCTKILQFCLFFRRVFLTQLYNIQQMAKFQSAQVMIHRQHATFMVFSSPQDPKASTQISSLATVNLSNRNFAVHGILENGDWCTALISYPFSRMNPPDFLHLLAGYQTCIT